MQISIASNFNNRGIYLAAPDFYKNSRFYDDHDLWTKNNCLSWALGYRGDFLSHDLRKKEVHLSTVELMADFLAHTGILPINENSLIAIPEGHYPIAGFVRPDPQDPKKFFDYHWYGMGRDGKWFHKPGEFFPATQYDKKGYEIYNPLIADRRDLLRDYTYSNFIGFYAVRCGGAELFPSRQESYEGIRTHIHESLRGKLFGQVIQLTV